MVGKILETISRGGRVRIKEDEMMGGGGGEVGWTKMKILLAGGLAFKLLFSFLFQPENCSIKNIVYTVKVK